MLNETYRAMLNNKSVIRETFMYGRQRAAQIGNENVFDYSLGNPSVPCPPEFTEAMQTLLAQEEPVSLHGYCPSQGDPGFRTAVAAHLTETFGLPYAQKHIFPTTGAAGAIAHAIRAVTQPGDEVLTFAPYFPEYGPYVAGTGAVLRVVPPQAPTFQPNLDAFAQMLTEKVNSPHLAGRRKHRNWNISIRQPPAPALRRGPVSSHSSCPTPAPGASAPRGPPASPPFRGCRSCGHRRRTTTKRMFAV